MDRRTGFSRIRRIRSVGKFGRLILFIGFIVIDFLADANSFGGVGLFPKSKKGAVENSVQKSCIEGLAFWARITYIGFAPSRTEEGGLVAQW